MLFLCAPIETLSLASSKSSISTDSLSFLAAISAASLTRLAKSAPLNLEYLGPLGEDRSHRTSRFSLCVHPIASLPFVRFTDMNPTIESSGTKNGWIENVGTIGCCNENIPLLASNPSISTSNWFRVCSRSSWPPPMPAPRCRPRTDFIYEDDARSIFPCSEISNTACTHTNKHSQNQSRWWKRRERLLLQQQPWPIVPLFQRPTIRPWNTTTQTLFPRIFEKVHIPTRSLASSAPATFLNVIFIFSSIIRARIFQSSLLFRWLLEADGLRRKSKIGEQDTWWEWWIERIHPLTLPYMCVVCLFCREFNKVIALGRSHWIESTICISPALPLNFTSMCCPWMVIDSIWLFSRFSGFKNCFGFVEHV